MKWLALGIVIGMGSLVGCGSEPVPTDAGVDAPIDAGSDAGPPDAGPICEAACDPGAACCADDTGAASCVVLASDAHHCGRCNIDCIASGRGDACQRSQCSCGDFDIGCIGRFESTCCVPPDGMGVPHCANLAQDVDECGACGRPCDPMRASDCQGGNCVCGGTRRQCAGGADDRCCVDRFEVYDCVDTTTDRNHCGECGNVCEPGFRCVSSACVPL